MIKKKLKLSLKKFHFFLNYHYSSSYNSLSLSLFSLASFFLMLFSFGDVLLSLVSSKPRFALWLLAALLIFKIFAGFSLFLLALFLFKLFFYFTFCLQLFSFFSFSSFFSYHTTTIFSALASSMSGFLDVVSSKCTQHSSLFWRSGQDECA